MSKYNVHTTLFLVVLRPARTGSKKNNSSVIIKIAFLILLMLSFIH